MAGPNNDQGDAAMQVKVKEYKNAGDFDRDAQRMVRDGWEIQQQSQGSTHMNLGRTFFSTVFTGGLNLVTPKIGGASLTKGKITVTWVKGGAKKKCPACAEMVRAEAHVCRFCRHEFS
ncbi:MAG: hypothetical protein HY511_08955, partial [Actinobacteria bacterium]|nr:hypothetical protein [Actinomycetota bacterium]